jgi:hypothetical protein
VRGRAIGFACLGALFLVPSTASGQSAPRRDSSASVSRAAHPSDLLPKPLTCGTKGSNPESCLLTSVVGTLRITPHIVRPGHVVAARIEGFSCIDIPFTGPCPVVWEPTGTKAPPGSFASYFTPTRPCGKLDHICRWRVSKGAPTMRYHALGANITRTEGVEGVEAFDAILTDYVGILGPKPPPPLPKPVPVGPGPPSQPIVPIPPP